MACFICFVHKGILPCNNTGAACPEPPGKTSVISPPTLKLFGARGGPSGLVSSEVMPPGCYCADYWALCVLIQIELSVPTEREKKGELMEKTDLLYDSLIFSQCCLVTVRTGELAEKTLENIIRSSVA